MVSEQNMLTMMASFIIPNKLVSYIYIAAIIIDCTKVMIINS